MRRRLVLLSAAITAMVVIAFVIPLGLLVRDLAADRATTPAQLRAQSLGPVIGLADETTALAAVEAAQQAVPGDVHVALPDGTILGVPAPDGVMPDRAGVFALDDGRRVAVVPVVSPNGTGVVMITIPAKDLRDGVAGAWLLLGLLGALLVIAGAAMTDRLARSSTRALGDVEDVARRLSQGDLTSRSNVAEPLEVGRIADALNELADRTQELLVEERERAADLSHALRTPVTSLRLNAEGIEAGVERDRLLDDLAAMETAVDRAIHEARRPVREGGRVRCDLAVIARDRVQWWSALAADEDRNLFDAIAIDHAFVRSSIEDVEQLLDALIGNVFSHTEPGVGLRVVVARAGSQVELVVEDDGPGFPDNVDVLERGVSGGGSTGLGLAIAAATASAAGGSIAITSHPSRVRVALPEVVGPR